MAISSDNSRKGNYFVLWISPCKMAGKAENRAAMRFYCCFDIRTRIFENRR